MSGEREDILWARGLLMLRSEHGLIQRDLAKMLDVDNTSVSMLESGKRPFSLLNLRRIARWLGVSTGQAIVILEAKALQADAVEEVFGA